MDTTSGPSILPSVPRATSFPVGVSVVVPVYNSESTLATLIERLEPVLRATGGPFEVILVNDASRDGSWTVTRELAHTHTWIRGLNLMRNYGQHNALLCGIRAASFDRVVTIDDDLQNPPEEIPRLLEKLDEGFDVVYGTPEKERHGLLRDLASQITKLALQSAMGVENATRASAFRVFRTQVRDAFADYQNSTVSIDVLLSYGTQKFSYLTVTHHARAAGRSNYTAAKLIRHALNTITSFSTLPLQLATMLGFAMTAFGIAILLYVIGVALFLGRAVPGFAFLASLIAIFSGTQMFALGIIGEYLARIHFRTMDHPPYTVRDVVAGVPESHVSTSLDRSTAAAYKGSI